MEEMIDIEYLEKQKQSQPQAPERKTMVRAKKKLISIYDAAQTGDLKIVQSRLQEDPALINLRNPIMSETLLHKAAANNHTEVMKFLLDWKGEQKPELEGKNMVISSAIRIITRKYGIMRFKCNVVKASFDRFLQYGETPLHLAAKNGCTEAVKLLLEHNAFKEAKTSNGMRPLHLAVWYSMRAGTMAAVEALLQADVDIDAKDDESKTPISHLPKSPSTDKLRELLQSYPDRQQTRKSHTMINALETALKPIVGLDGLKSQLRKWAKGTLLNEKRRALGLDVPALRPPHMAFLGSPGTGKTMIARLLAELLHMVGILEENKVVEVQRTDLVGEFVGHTGPRTRAKMKEAEGGMLFVDEAYRLMPVQSNTDKDYGIEALEEIMSFMDTGKVMVIFAGYPEPMQRLVSANQGFCRRVTRFFHFDDFSPHEIAEIVVKKVQEHKLGCFKLAQECSVDAIATLLVQETSERQRHLLNGGMVWPLLVNARETLDERLDLDCHNSEELVTITMADLTAACSFLPVT